jgi:hypothetical protein
MKQVWHAKMWFDERNGQKATDLIPTEGIGYWGFWDDNCWCIILSAAESVALREVLATLRKAFPITPIYTGYCNGPNLRNVQWASMA